MKIVLVSYFFPPDQLGGAETYTYSIATAFQRLGHEVWILCARVVESSREEIKVLQEDFEGLQVIRLVLYTKTSTRYNTNHRVYEWALEWFQRLKIDIVYCGLFWYMIAVLRAAHQLTIPLFLIAHGYDLVCVRNNLIMGNGYLCDTQAGRFKCVDCQFPGNHWIFKILIRMLSLSGSKVRKIVACFGIAKSFRPVLDEFDEMRSVNRWISRHVLKIITPSEFNRKVHQINGIPLHLLQWVPLGVNKSLFQRNPRSGPLKVMSFIGRFDPAKGLHHFLEAFLSLDKGVKIEFRMYGDTEHPNYRGYASKLKVAAKSDSRVRFMGAVIPKAMPDVLRESDLLVLPSRLENSPVSVQEALAMGVPVLCSRVGGMIELVENGVNGMTFEAGKIEEIKSVLIRLTMEPKLLERLRQGARIKYDIDTSAKNLISFFQQSLISKIEE